MCWKTKNIENTIRQTATKNIVVYKVLNKHGISTFQEQKYIMNKETEPLYVYPEINDGHLGEWYIFEGHHSYRCKPFQTKKGKICFGNKGSLRYQSYKKSKINIHTAIIPKGTCYYENEYGEVVSDSIIVTDMILSFPD